MRNNKNERGFTLMEVLIAVAILVILMAFGFISLFQHQRSLKQLELDETAKEIYVAAQNHLTMAKGQNLLKGKGLTGEPLSGDIYYYVVDGATNTELQASNAASRDSVLYLMLPQYAIDETVRSGGSYVIRYDLKNAAVLEVFYTDLQAPAKTAPFVEGEAANLFDNYSGEDKKDARRDYDGDIIGWYDGSDLPSREPAKLAAPTVVIRNAEMLTATIKFSAADYESMKGVAGVSMRVYVEGKTSGNTVLVSSGAVKGTLNTMRLGNVLREVGGEYVSSPIVLDSITTSGEHFAQLFVDDPMTLNTNEGLIPGEDISVYVEVFSNDELSSIARSAKKTTNSLFDSVVSDETKETGKTVKVARISNFRHLENLSKAISGFDSADLVKAKDANSAIEYFEQTADIVWRSGSFEQAADANSEQAKEKEKGFLENVIYANHASDVATYKPSKESYNESVVIYDKSGQAITEANQYAPVTPTTKVTGTYGFVEYDGKGLKVSNVSAKHTGDSAANVGLFATVQGGAIKNVDLVNMSASTKNGNAGALAAELNGTDVSGVAAYNKASDDSAYGVEGSGSVGGLVGSMTGGKVELSAASVYVKSTGSNGAAGGLVGSTSADATISQSYSGGHTKNGLYQSTTETKDGETRVNVQAEGEGSVAGGLIGKANGTGAVSQCYSTSSAYGPTAGGLIGTMGAGSVSNSYATGLVVGKNDTATKGAFVGNLTGGTLGDNNQYFSAVNYSNATSTGSTQEMPAVGNGTASKAPTALDANVDSYKAFMVGTSKAQPYDTYLTQRFDGAYSLKNIKELSGSTDTNLPKLATSHYGDWPIAETLVVNTKS